LRRRGGAAIISDSVLRPPVAFLSDEALAKAEAKEGLGFVNQIWQNNFKSSRCYFWLRTLNEIRTFFSENPNAEF